MTQIWVRIINLLSTLHIIFSLSEMKEKSIFSLIKWNAQPFWSLKSSEEAFVTIESLLPSSNFKLSMSMTSCSGSKRVPLSKFHLQLATETTGIGAQKRYHYPIGPDFCYGSSISSYIWSAFFIWLVAWNLKYQRKTFFLLFLDSV